MKKNTIVLLSVLAVVALTAIWGVNKYNSFVTGEEKVTSSWSKVESAYQRRADLIPNLVNTVKGYAKHENQTLVDVIEARAKATQVTVDPANLTAESIAAYQKAQNNISAALGKLMVIREEYPELKADKMFLELQTQLEGTENRINVERNNFNEAVKAYNVSLRKFPANIVANICGFDQKAYFQADEAAATAPTVSFE